MKGKKTVFVLGAGASCPYGYPSGARLRERICLPEGFMQELNYYRIAEKLPSAEDAFLLQETRKFKEAFNKSHIKSIDMFMANNPKLASIGKYIIAFEIFRAEQQSLFAEQTKFEQNPLVGKTRLEMIHRPLFLGEDWYFYLYNRIIEGMVGKGALPDFSNGNLTFITFNYDRSLEQFLYESLRNSYTETPEEKIVEVLRQLRIIHVYGQIAPLKWQDATNFVDYKPPVHESLLQKTAKNIRTIYEEEQNPELKEAQNLLKQAREIFFLGFGYAKENMDVLGLPEAIPEHCFVYGTAFGLYDMEIDRIVERMKIKSAVGPKIKKMDCLELLRNYFEY